MFFVVITFILITAGMVWFFLGHDRGAKEPVGALWMAAAFGFAAFVAGAFIEQPLIPKSFISGGAPLGAALGAALLVGVIEETVKFVPLAWYIRGKSYFNEHTDGVIYFGICGLTFGLLENIFYTMEFGASTGIARIILVPILHCATTGSVGYYLARAELSHRSFNRVWLALAGASVLHGFYDFGLASRVPALTLMSIMITLLLAIGLFLFYMRAGELDEQQGLSAVGHNEFCRHCGRPNAHHTLYCELCGQPT